MLQKNKKKEQDGNQNLCKCAREIQLNKMNYIFWEKVTSFLKRTSNKGQNVKV